MDLGQFDWIDDESPGVEQPRHNGGPVVLQEETGEFSTAETLRRRKQHEQRASTSLFAVRPTFHSSDAAGIADDHSVAPSEYSTATEESPVVSRGDHFSDPPTTKKKRSLKQLFKRKDKTEGNTGDGLRGTHRDTAQLSPSHFSRKQKIKLITKALKVGNLISCVRRSLIFYCRFPFRVTLLMLRICVS